MELKGKKINFLGDSITYGVGASSEEKTYHGLIAQREGIIARNYGISGSKIAKHVEAIYDIRGNMPFCLRVDEMDADTDAVVVFGGTNDYGAEIPLCDAGYTLDKYTFYGALHILIRALLERYPGKPIIFMTPIHRIGEKNNRKSCGKPLSKYVQMIRDVCEAYSIPVCDLYKNAGIYADDPAQRELYVPDGLHPNDAGHELIASRLTAFLKSL